MTPTPTAAPRVSGTIKADARAALEELANMSLGIPLEDWCRLSSRILAAIQPDPEPQPVEGRATNMPLADMARAEAYRSLSRCLRDPKEIKKLGLAKDPTLLDVLAWHDRRIAQLDATPPSAGTVSVEALKETLEFYGNSANYYVNFMPQGRSAGRVTTGPAFKDSGDKARAALRALAGEGSA